MISDHIDELFNKLKLIPDLTKVLGNDGEFICPILKEEAIFLLKFGKEKHIVDLSQGYIEGDKINIISGPLVGYEGMIKRLIDISELLISKLNYLIKLQWSRWALKL